MANNQVKSSRRAPRETGLARQQQREKVLALMAKKPKPKYRAVRCEVDGEKFDSKREMRHWFELQTRQKLGEICKLRRQQAYQLIVNDVPVGTYVADFVFDELCGVVRGRRFWNASPTHVIADSKGVRTRDYILKRKLMLACHGISIREL